MSDLPAQLLASEYRSYLLRVWRGGPESAWRATLERIADGQRWSFNSPEVLVAFLRAKDDPLYKEPSE